MKITKDYLIEEFNGKQKERDLIASLLYMIPISSSQLQKLRQRVGIYRIGQYLMN